jgi:predicted  nucleic acid-binding Zn-ribbon protein
MTREEDIQRLNSMIASEEKWIAIRKASIERGTNKLTGAPLSERTIRNFQKNIEHYEKLKKRWEDELEQVKKRPVEFDDFYKMSHLALVAEAMTYYKLNKKLEEEIANWQEWYKRQDRRPPTRKKNIPSNWQIVPGGAQKGRATC